MASPSTVVVQLLTHTEDPFVQEVVGKTSWTPGVDEFRGIPYADVAGRWKHSTLRRELPSDSFDASKNGPRCPQPQAPNNSDTFHSYLAFPDVTEDELTCLNLFIIRPNEESLGRLGLRMGFEKLPAYVYIHGGGYGFGAATDPMWDPTRLVASSIALGRPFITVGINYRLNIFGFAASPLLMHAQKDIAGIKGCNFGLVDQRNALEWVSTNISAFGGDPNQITLGGQSAGASSVHAHVIEATAVQGYPLFSRAIMESGAMGTLGPSSMASAQANFDSLTKALDLTGLDDDEMLARLRAVPASKIVDTGIALGWWVFPLTLDGHTIRTSTTRRWEVSLGNEGVEPVQRPSRKQMVVMAGDCDTEASIWDAQVLRLRDFAEIQALLRTSLSESAIAKFHLAYPMDATLSLASLRRQITQFLSDYAFGHPVHLARGELGNRSSLHHTTSVQSFNVRYRNPFQEPEQAVSHHCVELIYVFDAFHEALQQVDAKAGSSEHADLVRATQKHWIEFITRAGEQDIADDQTVVWNLHGKTIVKTLTDQDMILRTRRFKMLENMGAEAGVLFSVLTSIEVDK
ncbi:alpha/beta-hydrolase, partial [Aureobasidium melanogenum]